LQLTDADLEGDGYYRWSVTAIGSKSDNTSPSRPSAAYIFQYLTTRTLETPAHVSPPNGVFLYDTTFTQTLAWDPQPAVAAGGAALHNGYDVYIEQQTGSTWTAVTNSQGTSPFNVPLSSPTGWQNASFTFVATVATGPGTYRWAVVALGDGSLAIDSPAPSDSKPKQWWEFTFDAP
jgi:hypothetical protein